MEERRKAGRRRVLKKAKIIFNNRSAVIDCTVRNLSTAGALLLVPSPLGIPETFELLIEADGTKYQCHVSWRQDDKIGVAFI